MSPSISPEEARKIAAGPLGLEVSKFPLRSAKPVFFGDPPVLCGPSRVNNGTVSLINLGKGPLAVTCFHVIEEYRRKIGHRRGVFQIGECRVDVLAQLVSENEHLDLAVIGLTERQAREITQEDANIGSFFFTPVSWPPERVSRGDFVACAGFPGAWRTRLAFDTVGFLSFAIGATGVTAVNDEYFVSQLEREYWVKCFETPGLIDPDHLGGLSGGPVFIHRDLRFDFVGIIYQFLPGYDLLRLRHAGLIDADGQIRE